MNLSIETKPTNQPKISVGMPVYNEEALIRKKLDSLLAQTFTDFELIISDNASTDSTSEICEEYSKKDTRIRYIRQKKNMGALWNFNFVLQEAKYDYFVWAAADDIILPEFLEKNINILVSKKNFVGSISNVELYEIIDSNLKPNTIDLAFKKFIRKLSRSLKSLGAYSISGSYEKKVRFYLKRSPCQILYGVYRTDELRKSIIQENFVGSDWPIVLNVLKHGDFNVIDEVLMYRYGGISETGMINLARQFNDGFLGIIFPFYPITFWCAKHLGMKIFLKNLDYFIQLNLEGAFSLLVDLIRVFTHTISRK